MSIKSLFQTFKSLDWPRNSPKFAAFFAAYGLLAGTILGNGGDFAKLLYHIAGGLIGAFIAGYLLPRSFSFQVYHNQGPVLAQITNGVFGALAGSIIVFLALGGWTIAG